MNAFDPFVGLPWRDRGRGLDGCDCWGLVRLVLASRGAALPSYAGQYRNTCDRAAIGGLIAGERDIVQTVAAGEERPFDLVLLRQHPWHIGVVVGEGMMLHMPAEQTSCIEPYTTNRFASRIEGFYRHGALI